MLATRFTARPAVRSSVAAKAADRPLWFPGNAAPKHLNGTLPGDYGFDPLRLGSDEQLLKWFVEAELQNGRWAMLGVAGILVGELARPDINFYSAGADVPSPIPIPTLLAIEFLLFHFVEVRRWQDFRNPGSVDQDPIFTNNKLPAHEVGYPGGIFDPLGFAKGNVAELKVKEIKNARLAMVAFVGFVAAEQTTGKNPLAALGLHLSNPGHQNIFTFMN